MSESRGVVYVATGEKFVTEALISVRSVKKQMPGLPIALFTDLQDLVGHPPEGVDAVFHLTQVTNSCLDKMYPLVDSPYDRTLFLDTDTYLCDRVDELFDVLDHYDIAAAHPPIGYNISSRTSQNVFQNRIPELLHLKKLLRRWRFCTVGQ